MNRKEREQLIVFSKIKKGEIGVKEAAQMLDWCIKWVRKKLKRFSLYGTSGLIHKGRGKESRKKWNSNEEAFTMQLFEGKFDGFGPTFAAEKLLTHHNIKISRETLRKYMIANGHWFIKKKRSKHRKRRERKPCIGMMIQLDGSPHDWFEGRASKCTAIVFIDDATGKLMCLELVKSESEYGVMSTAKHYIEEHGRPKSFYVDYGCVFSVNVNNKEHDKLTQFERACREIGINVIHASSPQAKGRVERSNKTLQDRLVKEMRLRGISSIAEANDFIKSEFIGMYNDKFAVEPCNAYDAHCSAQGINLDDIFCTKHERILQNDFTISYKTRILQLTSQQKTILRPKNQITILDHLDKTLSLRIRSTELEFVEIDNRPLKVINKTRACAALHHNRPAPEHPWRRPLNFSPIFKRRDYL